jgi:hypothetical protein
MSRLQPPPLPRPPTRSHAAFIVLIVVFTLCCLSVIGVTSYFRLSSETNVLRESVMRSADGRWQKRIAVNLGWLTTGLVRAGSHLFKMPAEPRAALDSIRGVEVGVYHLAERRSRGDRAGAMACADKAMRARGWDRVVGVLEDNDVVALYMPRKPGWTGTVKCCVMVLNGQELVVASVRGNPEPLLALAADRAHLSEKLQRLACR